MKKSLVRKLRAAISILLSLFISTSALAEVNFYILPVKADGDITEEAANVVYKKAEQILTRNSAAASGVADVFAIEAKLTVTGENTTSGLIQDVTSISGELTLVALNKIDNSKYYSVTVPLKAASKGDKSPVLTLANSIKTTEPVYTRFVRTAREKIETFFAEHCDEILARAKGLALGENMNIALAYLLGMPASAPCYEEALELMAGLRARINQENDEKKDPDNNTESADNGESGNSVEKTDEEEPIKESPISDETEIYVQNPNWNFKLQSAEYIPASRKIKLTALITYTGNNSGSSNCAVGFRTAYNNKGESYDRCFVEGDRYRPFPENVPVKVVYYIDNVKTNPDILKYVGLEVDYQKVELRNVKVKQ